MSPAHQPSIYVSPPCLAFPEWCTAYEQRVSSATNGLLTSVAYQPSYMYIPFPSHQRLSKHQIGSVLFSLTHIPGETPCCQPTRQYTLGSLLLRRAFAAAICTSTTSECLKLVAHITELHSAISPQPLLMQILRCRYTHILTSPNARSTASEFCRWTASGKITLHHFSPPMAVTVSSRPCLLTTYPLHLNLTPLGHEGIPPGPVVLNFNQQKLRIALQQFCISIGASHIVTHPPQSSHSRLLYSLHMPYT